ncbi:MAG TPA: hypothetical protein VIW03_10165, partial [Anaeromyxobacter sp.]
FAGRAATAPLPSGTSPRWRDRCLSRRKDETEGRAVLPDWMIEAIEKERREREERERARLWIESPLPPPPGERSEPERESSRVITIDIL